jgi:carboxymethylenebutenolidase
MANQLIDITTPDGLCESYVSYPDSGGPFPAVLFYMDGVGFRPTLHRMADRIASAGYFVFLPNLFYRRGRAEAVDVRELFTPESRAKRMDYVRSLTPELLTKDAGVFLGFLSSRKEVDPSSKIGLTGYCMGGSMALRTAARYPDRIGAAASFHGGRLVTDAPDSPHRLVESIGAELYFGHADKDEAMTAADIARLEEALKAAGSRYESELYAGAQHGYTMKDLPMYDEAAAERHFDKLLGLFERNLKAG